MVSYNSPSALDLEPHHATTRRQVLDEFTPPKESAAQGSLSPFVDSYRMARRPSPCFLCLNVFSIIPSLLNAQLAHSIPLTLPACVPSPLSIKFKQHVRPEH